jgi:diguanylate cyclase (GGDEF)-like protein/PAS domain S-box-containing protein
MQQVHEVLVRQAVSSVFQPIVDLDSGAVVAYEALARGPVGPLERPDALFAAARSVGRLAELDDLCRRAAFTGAVEHGLLAPLTLFVNVEPEVLDTAPLDDLLAIAEAAPGELRVVLEITERALATRPADLLRTVERVRALGWSVALDDVGAETLSLAFMPLLRPDVVKLDLRLVQDRPGPAVAEIMNAVNDHAEQTGALVLAEGIETQAHLLMARALGARLGQGWMFGRPAAGAAKGYPVAELALPRTTPPTGLDGSPFDCLPAGVALRRSPKALLIEVSKQLERQAMRLGETCVVAATFQDARHFAPSTAQRYRDLVKRTGFVCVLGEDLPVEPVPGVRGAALSRTDPVRGEWDVTVVSPHFSAALLARDLGDTGPDMERMFEYALTYERDTVVAATNALLSRVVPRLPATEQHVRQVTGPHAAAAPVRAVRVRSGGGEELLHRALAATTSGVTIAAFDQPDQPLVYVNEAFAAMAGFPVEHVLGDNCRFLQGPDTDLAAVARIRSALAAGEECRETLLNYRGPERTPWWNEVFLSPVADEQGRVLQYIGVQNDVTARVEADRALALERDRAASYLARIERFAFTDPLTGLANRRGMEERLEVAMWDARSTDEAALAVLFLDLDGFKRVNDRHGHAVGDQLLVRTAGRLSARLRRGDVLARLGGDEFLVVLCGLVPATARAEATRVADSLVAALSAPLELDGSTVQVGVSVGVGVFPADAPDLRGLLHAADLRMYAAKRAPATAGERQE